MENDSFAEMMIRMSTASLETQRGLVVLCEQMIKHILELERKVKQNEERIEILSEIYRTHFEQ